MREGNATCGLGEKRLYSEAGEAALQTSHATHRGGQSNEVLQVDESHSFE